MEIRLEGERFDMHGRCGVDGLVGRTIKAGVGIDDDMGICIGYGGGQCCPRASRLEGPVAQVVPVSGATDPVHGLLLCSGLHAA